eukprot:scaffold7351_cov259-Pinguiococcus_pyrenoidosus.AAC.14
MDAVDVASWPIGGTSERSWRSLATAGRRSADEPVDAPHATFAARRCHPSPSRAAAAESLHTFSQRRPRAKRSPPKPRC